MKPAAPIPVLSLGANDFFVARLYGAMRRRWPELAFYPTDYTRYGDAVNFAEDEAFAGHVQTHPGGADVRTLTGLGRALLQTQLWRRLAVAAFFRGQPFQRDSIGYAIRAARFRADVLSRRSFAVWHVHFCSPGHLAYVDVKPRGVPLICSFWGSDLLRAGEAETQWHVRRGVRQAAAITTQSVELKEIILSLYGRDLAPRIHVCRFPAQTELLDALDRLGPAPLRRQHARAHLDLPRDDLIIAVGNNGHAANRQLEVTQSLAALPAGLRARTLVVFPCGYGSSDALARQLADAGAAAGLRTHVERRFLDWEKLAALRAAADFTIHVPISDALSHLPLEAVYAGSRAIVGAWLPYGPYRRSGLPLAEVETIAQLPAAITAALGEAPRDNEAALAALRARIRESASAETLAPAWLEAYRAALAAGLDHG